MDEMICCTACGRLDEANHSRCPHCGTPHELTRGQRAGGVAFLLNELSARPAVSLLTDHQLRRLREHYEQDLERLTGRPLRAEAAGMQPVVAAGNRQPATAPAVERTRAAAPPQAPAPPRTPRDWSWLAEQQANLFLFAGAFLTVVAALIYVGYSGQAVGGALKMSLLIAYTIAFLAAGTLCLRIPRVAMAGQVFFGVGAILVPMNFVAARNIIGDQNLSAQSIWLAGSLVTALFYTSIAYIGLSRWYAFASGAAVISAALAGVAVSQAPTEWVPAMFISLALLMSLTNYGGTTTLRERIGKTWRLEAHAVAAAATLLALVVAPLASDRPREFEVSVATFWFLPAALALLAAYAALPALIHKRQAEAAVALAASGAALVSIVYATRLPHEYYVVALAALAPAYGLAMLAASMEQLKRRLPEGASALLSFGGSSTAMLALVAALFVLNAMNARTDPFVLHTRWFLATSAALTLPFFLLDAFARRNTWSASGAALSLSALAAGAVFGLNVRVEYYSFALITSGAVTLAFGRWVVPAIPERVRAKDLAVIGTGFGEAAVAAGMAVAILVAAPGAGSGAYQPQSLWFLIAAFISSVAALAIHLTGAPASSHTKRVATYQMGLALLGCAIAVPYGLHADAAWYGAALAASGLAFGFGGRAWTPSWFDARTRDLFAVVSVTLAWLLFEGTYRNEPAVGAAVHLAAAVFYAAAALRDRDEISPRAPRALISLQPVRRSVGWLYAAALTASIGYVHFLHSLPGAEHAGRGSTAIALSALMLGFALLGASARWWRPDFRAHLYVVSLFVALASLSLAPDPLTLASMLTAYAVVFAIIAAWEDSPSVLAPSAVFAFIAVAAWRSHFDLPLAAIPLAYTGIAGTAAAAAAQVRAGWRMALGGMAAAFALAAPGVGFGILLANTHHGLAFGERWYETPLYQWSTLTLAVAGMLLLALAAFEQRVRAIAPASALLVSALLLEIGHFRPANPQAYTLVVGSYLVLLGLVGIWKFRLVPQLVDAAPFVEAAGTATIMLPSYVQSFGGHWEYSIVVLIEAAVALTAGAALRRRSVLGAGLLFLVLVAVHVLFDAVNALPNWLAVMVAGMALLAVGVAILSGRERWDAWQRVLLGWWDAPGAQGRM